MLIRPLLAMFSTTSLRPDWSSRTQLTDALQGNIDARYRLGSSNFSDTRNQLQYENVGAKQLFLRMGVSGKWGSLSLFGDNLLNRDGPSKVPPHWPAAVHNECLRTAA